MKAPIRNIMDKVVSKSVSLLKSNLIADSQGEWQFYRELVLHYLKIPFPYLGSNLDLIGQNTISVEKRS